MKGILGRPPANRWVDVVVVGSGPGGAVTAAEFAAAGASVLVLEEGPAPRTAPPRAFSRGEMEAWYRAGGITPALGPAPVAYAEGRCVGGGSAVNSRLYHRTPDAVLERWQREYDVRDLAPADMEPQFVALESEMRVAVDPGGSDAVSRRLRDGAAALGWAATAVPQWQTRNALARAVAAGARILPGCRVERLISVGGKWDVVGRCATADGSTAVRWRTGTVVVAGGAIQTPLLLRRSGIRDRVGRTLALHPTVKVVARFPEPVQGAGPAVGIHQVREFWPDFSLGCSVGEPPHLALALLDHRTALADVPRSADQMAVYYAMVPTGQGTVRALPGLRDPLVRYDVGREGLVRLARGVRALTECLLAAGAVAVFPSVTGVSEVRTSDDLDRLPTALRPASANLMSVHIMGSCPMGENRRRCAVDSHGGVHGHPGLMVADASMLCDQVGVNPQGTIMAVARRNARVALYDSG